MSKQTDILEARLRVVESERDQARAERQYYLDETNTITSIANDYEKDRDHAVAALADYKRNNLFSSLQDGLGLLILVAGAALSFAAMAIYDGPTISWLLAVGLTLIGGGLIVSRFPPTLAKVGVAAAWVAFVALFTYQQAVKTSEASFKTVDAGSVGSYATASDAGDIVWAVSTSVNLKLGETRRWIGGDSAECAAKGIAPMTGVVDSDGRSTRVRMGPGSYYTFSDGTSVECEAEPKFSHEKFLLPPDEPAQKKK